MNKKIQEFRRTLAEDFANILEEKGLEWRKNWRGISAIPHNAKTGADYKGINRIRLYLTAEVRGYKDKRWATFKQVSDMGLHLKDAKGHGVSVEYWYPYDRVEHKKISWEEFNILTQGKPDERYIITASYAVVFNGDLIEGLQPEELKEQRIIEPSELVGTLSKEMGVEILNDGGDRAFYRKSEDKIHLPIPEAFFSSYDYDVTALHELSHATGAPHRLNREMNGVFGSEPYAFEELVAEMASCFIAAYLPEEQEKFNIDNHKAYVQSWASMLREKPEILPRAVAQAQKAASYMEYKAGLVPAAEYEKALKSDLTINVKETKTKKIEMKGPKL